MKYDKPIKTDFKAFYKSLWGMAFIGYFVAMGLVGALTPSDILTAYSWTGPFTDFMASIVPQIDKVTALGIEPDINRFYFSVMWAGSPMVVVLLCLSGQEFRKNEKTNRVDHFPRASLLNMPFVQSLKIIAPILLMLIACYHVEWVTASRTRLTIASFGNSLGRFGMPQVFVLGVIIFGFMFSIWLLGWLTGYIPRNIRKQNELENNHGK